MRFNLLLIFSMLAFIISAQEENPELRMDFESYDPPSTLVVPEHITTHAKFPFIDIHSHHWRMADQDLEARVLKIQGKNIFRPKRLHICKSRNDSKEINKQKNYAIIISSSGMVTGGRILHHLAERLPREENTILFVGYQAEGTRGRAILEGKPEIKIHGRNIPVNAKIENITGYSGHADYNEILAWLMGFNKAPEKTFIVHGEPEASSAMKEKIEQKFGWNVEVPEFGQSFELEL